MSPIPWRACPLHPAARPPSAGAAGPTGRSLYWAGLVARTAHVPTPSSAGPRPGRAGARHLAKPGRRTGLALACLLVAAAPGPGCAGGGDLGDCESQPPGTAQEDCRLAVLMGLDVAQAAQAIGNVPDPASRDLLRVRLVVQDPRRFGTLCADVDHEGSRDWCREVVDRPHLEIGSPP